VFAAKGVSVESLRTFGAGANALAFLIVVAGLRRRVSAETAAWGAAFLAGSAYLLLKSRLAWECYAVQPFLLCSTLSLVDEPVNPIRALIFTALTLFGVQNHFIYLSIPVSLCVLYGARAAWRGEEEVRPWLRLSLAALIMGAIVFLVKPRLSDAGWPRERVWAVPLFLALAPLAAASAFLGEWERPLVSWLARPAARRWCGRALALGLAAFFIWHARPLWQIFAEAVVWKRIFSWSAPWWLAVPLGAWAWFLLALLVWRAARAWAGHETMTPHERTLALWPAAYAAIFIAFRNTSSLRYYLPVYVLCAASLPSALARLARSDKKGAALFALIAIASTQGIFWHELASPGDRRPLSFKIGWHMENSKDFARKEALFAAFDASGACGVDHQERSFTAIPLNFHRETTGPLPCDPAKAFDADQCPDCPEPPYYRWSVAPASK
ncbi:MAG TPA: hypothetical protein VN915_13730, partial [Elusimicrobiota bacterium]|nr:hypothetical protein [Elusimicrobiota bacterium]